MRAALVTGVVVVVLGAAGVTAAFVTSGDHGGGPRRATSTVTTSAVTTTTIPATPDRIVPPRTPTETAAVLVRTEQGIRADDRDPARLRVLGWEQQLAYRQLANHDDWVPTVVASLPPDVRVWVQRNLDASAALSRITPPETSLPDWTILAPPSAETLRAYYGEAAAATGVPWAYLAAIHFLETRMGRIHGNSSAGAQGPMQFIPSTWAAYGNGGDVNDPHDAILGAARYLAAAGAPTDLDRAIFAYNHDDGYVAAVKAYAANMLEDPRAYDGYYQWQVYYRTVDGTLLLPEGYAPNGPIGARSLPPA